MPEGFAAHPVFLFLNRLSEYFQFTSLTIPDLGVRTAILNIAYFSLRWCKLNFGSLRSHVKSCQFPERIVTGNNIITFLYKCLSISGTK